MSIFSSNNWPPSCSSAKQSPINLTQSGAKPCNLKCDLVMDDGFVTQATVSISNEGMILESSSSLGSCKYSGESYVCQGISINHPSHHTIEGVQADGEVTAIFRKPTGELMCMSSLFRVNSAQTPSYSFFKQFVPYAVTTGETKLQLRDFSITSLVPPQASYYIYSGSSLVPPCVPCEWIVFKQMINMDQGDFAYLVRNVEAGSRPVQGLGDREVFFNDINNIPGGPMPNDGKFYLRLKPTGNSKVAVSKPSPPANLKENTGLSATDAAEEVKNPTTIQGWFKHMYEKYGAWFIAISVLAAIGVIGGIYAGYSSANTSPYTAEFAKPAAAWTVSMLTWLWSYIVSAFKWVWNILFGAFTWLIGIVPRMFEKAQQATEEAIAKKAAERAARPPKTSTP